jgi:hypothetical protein
MSALAHQRVSPRFEVKVPVMLEDFRTGFCYDGIICNYCAEGVYLESDYALRPGRKLRLKVDGVLDIFSAQTYFAEVRWRCCRAANKTRYPYGTGLKYC